MKTRFFAKPVWAWWLVLFTTIGLSGCHKRGMVVDRQYYPLQVRLEWVENAPVPQRSVPVYIPRAQALGVVGSRPMLAVAGDGARVQMHHHFWLDSPRVIWQNLFLDWASQSGLWPQVLDIKPPHPRHDTVLVTLLALEKNKQTATLGVRVEWLDARKQQRYLQTFRQQRDLPENSISAFVAAVSAMSETVMQQVDAAIRARMSAAETAGKAVEKHD